MRKCAFAFVCAVLLAVLSAVPARAVGLPRARSAKPTLTISGTEAYCSGSYRYGKTDVLSLTLTLKQGSTVIAEWSDTGKQFVNISEMCSVETGKTYTLVMTATVNGVKKATSSVTARS